jgi:hypothetical protein
MYIILRRKAAVSVESQSSSSFCKIDQQRTAYSTYLMQQLIVNAVTINHCTVTIKYLVPEFREQETGSWILLRSSIINNRAAASSGTLACRIDKTKSTCYSLSAAGNQPTWLVTTSVTYRHLAFRRENER